MAGKRKGNRARRSFPCGFGPVCGPARPFHGDSASTLGLRGAAWTPPLPERRPSAEMAGGRWTMGIRRSRPRS